MNFGMVFGLKNPQFEPISELGVDLGSQRADFAKIELLTLMQCLRGIFINKYQVLYHYGIVRSSSSKWHGAWIHQVPYFATVHWFVSSGGNMTCRVRGPISFWPPRGIFCFSSFFTPNTSQYWILIEFWPEFGFPDVLRAVFVKFPHFGHIFIHKMGSNSLGKHFLALVKKSNLA